MIGRRAASGLTRNFRTIQKLDLLIIQKRLQGVHTKVQVVGAYHPSIIYISISIVRVAYYMVDVELHAHGIAPIF